MCQAGPWTDITVFGSKAGAALEQLLNKELNVETLIEQFSN